MTRWIVFLLLTALLLAVVGAPTLAAIAPGLDASVLGGVAQSPVHQDGLLNSLAIAGVTTVLALLLAAPAAWMIARWRFRGRGWAQALLLGPLVLPPFVGAIGVVHLFGSGGALNALLGHGAADGVDWLGAHRFFAVCALEALHLYPVILLNLITALGRVDPALMESARVAGASPLTVARRIIAPLVAPGLLAGCLVVFVWSFTEIGTPLMLGYERATPVQLYNGLNGLAHDPTPFALAIVLLGVAVALSLVAQVLVSSDRTRTSARGGGMQPQPCSALRSAWCWLICGGVAFIACLPHLGVLGVAFSRDWYQTALPTGATLQHARDALAHPLVVPSVLNSLWFSVLATALCLVLALAVAWTVQRWRLPGARLIDALAMAPLAIPGVVMALGFLTLGVTVGKMWPAAQGVIDPMQNPTLLLVIAYAVRRLPQALRSVSAGLGQVPVELEEAAAACGAGPWQRIRRIILPLIAGALAAGGILAFSFAMLEVADSLILAQQREFWPITKVIFDLVNVLGQGPALACAFGVWAMLFLAASLAAAAAAVGKPLGDLLRDR